MSSPVVEIRKFQKTLKHLIFGKGLHYHDMARALAVSISTAKRMLNRDDLSLQNMIRICEWIEIDFYKVVEMTRDAQIEWEYLSYEQEEYLAASMGHYKFLKLLLRGLSTQDIMNQETISEAKARQYLVDLERIGLISFADELIESPVELNIGPRPDFIQYGPLWKTFFKEMAGEFVDHYFATAQERKTHQIEYGQRKLSTESYRRFCQEVDDLYKKFAMISEMEVETHPPEKLENMTCLIVIDSVWIDWLEGISL